MNKIEIGSNVKFVALNVNFQGFVTDIKGQTAFVAVLGQPHTFAVEIGACLPV